MQRRGETDENTCAYNDLALVKVDAADVAKVNPSVPFWGGPVGIDTDGTAAGETVYSYGNSSLRGGIEELSPKQGTSLGTEGDGWSHTVYTVTPASRGTRAAPSSTPRATRSAPCPRWPWRRSPGSNGVGDLDHELAYAQANGGIAGLALVPGTEPFTPVL